MQPEEVGKLFTQKLGWKLLGVELHGGTGSPRRGVPQEVELVLNFEDQVGLSYAVIGFRGEAGQWSCTGFQRHW
jgi:hypothetical protein